MKSNRIKRLTAAVLACVCAAGVLQYPGKPRTAQAVTIAELEATREMNNRKIQAYEEKLKQYSADQKQEQAYQTLLSQKIAMIEGNLQILDTEMEGIKANLAQLDAEIAALDDTITQQEKDLDKGLREFKLRLRAMYVSGNDSLASALVGATDFYDLLSKYELIACVARHDDELIKSLKSELTEYNTNLEALETQKAAAEQAKQERDAKLAEMKSSMAELQKSYAESQAEQQRIEEEKKNANASIEDLEEKNRLADEAEAEIFEAIQRAAEEARRRAIEEEAARRAAEEAARLAAEEAARQAASEAAQQAANEKQKALADAAASAKAAVPETTPFAAASPDVKSFDTPTADTAPASTVDYSDSSFGWPCPGHFYVSSTYGYRWGSLHKGIDISQNKGADVVASKSGKVIRAVSSCTHNYGKSSNCCGNGYGNHVIIMHDDGTYSTLYGHMERIVVSVGDSVKKGDTIGYVGSTGYSTGFHLHFEIRKNGTPIDPSGYLNY